MYAEIMLHLTAGGACRRSCSCDPLAAAKANMRGESSQLQRHNLPCTGRSSSAGGCQEQFEATPLLLTAYLASHAIQASQVGCHSFWPALLCAAAISVCNTKRQADNLLTDAGVKCHGAAAATASAPATFHLLVETTVCRF